MAGEQEKLTMLRDNTLFKGVPGDSLDPYLNSKKIELVKEGEILYTADEESNFLYLVVDGEVKIKDCKTRKVDFKRTADFFGEGEILQKTKRLSSAVTNADCLLYKINAADLDILIQSFQVINDNLKQEFNGGADSEKLEDPQLLALNDNSLNQEPDSSVMDDAVPKMEKRDDLQTLGDIGDKFSQESDSAIPDIGDIVEKQTFGNDININQEPESFVLDSSLPESEEVEEKTLEVTQRSVDEGNGKSDFKGNSTENEFEELSDDELDTLLEKQRQQQKLRELDHKSNSPLDDDLDGKFW